MDLTIEFSGGPLHGKRAVVDALPRSFLFFHPRDEETILYKKIGELEYEYDLRASRRLKGMYADLIGRITRPNIRFL